MKKALIFGARGMFGYAASIFFKQKSYHVIDLGREDFDILKDTFSKVLPLISEASLIINASGIIKSQFSNYTAEQIFIVNSLFPRNLGKFCAEKNIPCFHISTNGVFSGRIGGYTEKDYVDCSDLYGLSKFAGENVDCMCLRTTIIGEEFFEKKRSLLEWAKENKGKAIKGYTNQQWNGVTSLYLAEIIENIFSTSSYQRGIFHIFSPRLLNKKDLLENISKEYQLDLKIEESLAEENNNCTLSSIYSLSRDFAPMDISLQISQMKQFFEKKT